MCRLYGLGHDWNGLKVKMFTNKKYRAILVFYDTVPLICKRREKGRDYLQVIKEEMRVCEIKDHLLHSQTQCHCHWSILQRQHRPSSSSLD